MKTNGIPGIRNQKLRSKFDRLIRITVGNGKSAPMSAKISWNAGTTNNMMPQRMPAETKTTTAG